MALSRTSILGAVSCVISLNLTAESKNIYANPAPTNSIITNPTPTTHPIGTWTTKKYRNSGTTNTPQLTISKDKLTFKLSCKRASDDISISSSITVPILITENYIETLESSKRKTNQYGIVCDVDITKKKIFYTIEDDYLFIYKDNAKKKLLTTYFYQTNTIAPKTTSSPSSTTPCKAPSKSDLTPSCHHKTKL